MLFQNRFEAGRFLASKLRQYANRPDVVVLALPRGGVPVGFEVAKTLNLSLDAFIVDHTRAVEPLERAAQWKPI